MSIGATSQVRVGRTIGAGERAQSETAPHSARPTPVRNDRYVNVQPNPVTAATTAGTRSALQTPAAERSQATTQVQQTTDPAVLAMRAVVAFDAAIGARDGLTGGKDVYGGLGDKSFYHGSIKAEKAEAYHEKLTAALDATAAALAAGATQAQLPRIEGYLKELTDSLIPHRVAPALFGGGSQTLETGAVIDRMTRMKATLSHAPQGQPVPVPEGPQGPGEVPKTSDPKALAKRANELTVDVQGERDGIVGGMKIYAGLGGLSFYKGMIRPRTAEAYRTHLVEALTAAERALKAGATKADLGDVAGFVDELNSWKVPHRVSRALHDGNAQTLENDAVMSRIKALDGLLNG